MDQELIMRCQAEAQKWLDSDKYCPPMAKNTKSL